MLATAMRPSRVRPKPKRTRCGGLPQPKSSWQRRARSAAEADVAQEEYRTTMCASCAASSSMLATRPRVSGRSSTPWRAGSICGGGARALSAQSDLYGAWRILQEMRRSGSWRVTGSVATRKVGRQVGDEVAVPAHQARQPRRGSRIAAHRTFRVEGDDHLSSSSGPADRDPRALGPRLPGRSFGHGAHIGWPGVDTRCSWSAPWKERIHSPGYPRAPRR